MTTRRTFLALTAASLGAFSVPAWAAKAPVYATDGVAVNGYDVVAYFTKSEPIQGSVDFSTDWNGTTWQFANAEHRDLFAGDPAKYAPQYGGYCAYAAAKGYTATTSPNAWVVHEDKLYLNYNRAVRAIWRRDIPGYITKANANWPSVLNN